MSFKRFIYFCMICGGWAAFMTWGLATVLKLYDASEFVHAGGIGLLLGLLVASAIGFLDALLNSAGFQRVARPFLCLIVGTFGGLFGGLIGGTFFHFMENPVVQTIGWAIVGMAIGASIGVFDVLRAITTRAPLRQSIRKTINGIIGGLVGGVLGGLALVFLIRGFGFVFSDAATMNGPRALGLVILGMCIGLLIGTAQVVLKEAWVKVEAGFRPGREMMLSKPETTVGRAEGVDIALFGDKDCEKLHAKIVLKSGRYYLVDNGTPGGTFLNGERIGGPAPLRSGDLIQCGRSALRFGERAKRN
jgi:hypothetical protein